MSRATFNVASGFLVMIETAPKQSPDGIPTVLVVEDEALLRGALAKARQKYGFFVLEAPDGNHAMHLLATYAGEIHCMVLDVTLPGTPSPDVFKGAQQFRPAIRIVIISAHTRKTAEAYLQGIEIER